MHRIPDLPPVLTAEAEARLARAIEAGVLASAALTSGELPHEATESELEALEIEGHQAWQHFLLANLRLLWSLVRRADGRGGVETEELFQEGFLALTRAVQRYDHRRGRFSTYATPVVRQHLVAVTSSREGRLGIPTRRAVELRRAQALADCLGQERGRVAELAEIAEALGASVEGTRRLLGHRVQLSLDQLTPEQWAEADGLGSPEASVDGERIAADLDRLPGLERQALRLRFGFTDGRSRSYREIAAEVGTSASSARRICEHGLATLRHWHGGWAAETAP